MDNKMIMFALAGLVLAIAFIIGIGILTGDMVAQPSTAVFAQQPSQPTGSQSPDISDNDMGMVGGC